MSVRITDDDSVGLYDSVTDWAFGPVFPSAEAAGDFLDWYNDPPDLRTLSDAQLEALFALWARDRGSEYGIEVPA